MVCFILYPLPNYTLLWVPLPNETVSKDHCRGSYRFSIANEGLGGNINQIMVGKVRSVLFDRNFCLNSTLEDPNVNHQNDYSWLHQYWEIPLCEVIPPTACDMSDSFHHDYWDMHYVYRLYRIFYPEELLDLRINLAQSSRNKNFQYCVHVRTGDANSIPVVSYTNKTISLFGTTSTDYKFCYVNNCVLVPITKDVEFDFVNLANCLNLTTPDSSFSITAKLLSPHYDFEYYIKMARITNLLFTA